MDALSKVIEAFFGVSYVCRWVDGLIGLHRQNNTASGMFLLWYMHKFSWMRRLIGSQLRNEPEYSTSEVLFY
jgi:hypothetical protein